MSTPNPDPFASAFDDLVPVAPLKPKPEIDMAFADLVPAPAAPEAIDTAFDDLIPAPYAQQADGVARAGEASLWDEIKSEWNAPGTRLSRLMGVGGRLRDAVLPNSLQRGHERGKQGAALALDMLDVGPKNAYGEDADQMGTAIELARAQRGIDTYGASPEQEATQAAFSKNPLDTMVNNPLDSAGLIANVIGESLGTNLPGIGATVIGSLGGPGGTAAAAGTTSFATEYTQTILGSLQEAGVDPNNPAAWRDALANPELMARAKDSAVKRGVPIAIFDAATAGLAGKFITPVVGAGVRPMTAAVAKEGALQMLGGAAGESTAQVIDKGRITSAGDVVLEALAEGPTTAIEAGSNVMAARSTERADQARLAEAAEWQARTGMDPNYDPNAVRPGLQSKLTPAEQQQPIHSTPKVAVGNSTPPDPQQTPAPSAPAAAPPAATPAAGATPAPAPVAGGEATQGAADGSQQPAPTNPLRQTVTTAAGRKVDTEFQVVPLASLKPASGDLQNRDRSRATSDLQIQNIAGNLDPQRLGDSAEADRGAPIVGDDNVIESGNGRVAAIGKVYAGDPERAAAYQQFLSSRGHSIDGIDRPVLVRRRLTPMTPEERRAFVIESNTSATAKLNAVEQARSDADLVGDDVLQLYQGGEFGAAGNRDFVRALVGKLPPTEQAALYGADGALSQEGIRRVQNAMLARAYGDADLLSKLTEDQDNNIRSIGGALLDVAGPVSQLRASIKAGRVKPEFDITPKLVEAARVISSLRDRGMNIQQYLAQNDAFNPLDPITERLLKAFYDPSLSRAAGRDKITEILRGYAAQAENQTTEGGLFGAAEAVTPEQILDTLLGARAKAEQPASQPQMFGAGGKPTAQAKTQPQAQPAEPPKLVPPAPKPAEQAKPEATSEGAKLAQEILDDPAPNNDATSMPPAEAEAFVQHMLANGWRAEKDKKSKSITYYAPHVAGSFFLRPQGENNGTIVQWKWDGKPQKLTVKYTTDSFDEVGAEFMVWPDIGTAGKVKTLPAKNYGKFDAGVTFQDVEDVEHAFDTDLEPPFDRKLYRGNIGWDTVPLTSEEDGPERSGFEALDEIAQELDHLYGGAINGTITSVEFDGEGPPVALSKESFHHKAYVLVDMRAVPKGVGGKKKTKAMDAGIFWGLPLKYEAGKPEFREAALAAAAEFAAANGIEANAEPFGGPVKLTASGRRSEAGKKRKKASDSDAMEDSDDGHSAAVDDDEADAESDSEGEAAGVEGGSPQRNQRGRGSTPEIQRVSFTNRRSWAEQAFADAGVDPAAANLWPVEKQFEVLANLVKTKFGIVVQKSDKLQGRFAVDQLLDLYRNMQFMAHMLGMPAKAMGLRGSLHLVFRKDVHYFGAMYPSPARVEGVDFPAGTVVLPRRSNSFAHEWMHALDFFLMRKLALAEEGGRKFPLVSQQIRNQGVDYDPGTTVEAFVNLMNHLFFDQASLASKILALELKIGDPATSKSALAKAEAQLETLRRGNAQTKTVARTEYQKNSAGFEPGRADYWANPQELLARAFEAYTAFRVETLGGTTEAIAKGDAAYLSDAEARLAQTFPKGDERLRIFRAFDQLFANMAREQIVADGTAAAIPGNENIFDPRVWDKSPGHKAEYAGAFGMIKQTLDEMKLDWQQRQRQKARPKDPKTAREHAQDILRYPLYAQRSVFRMLERRYPNSTALKKLADLLVTAPGRDRVVGRVFEEAVEQRIKIGYNRLANIVERHGLEKLNEAELRTLRDLLISEDVPNAPANIKAAASELRKFLDTEWYRNQQAGLDIGYAKNGYLPRLLDMARVLTDKPGFVEKAAKVYEIIFDTEYGQNAEEIIARGDNFEGVVRFIKIAQLAGQDTTAVRAVVRKLRAKIRALDRAEDDEAREPIQAKIDELNEQLIDEIDAIFDATRTFYGKQRAEHWHTALMSTAVQDFDSIAPDAKYTKSRKLPPQADKLMEDYYYNDPLEAIQMYLSQSARRTEYATRFGAKGEKLQAMFDQLTKDKVSPEDQAYIQQMVTALTGRSSTGLPSTFARFLNFAHAIGTMIMLPRAVWSSLGEPTAAAIRSGDLGDTFRPYVNLVKQVVGTATAKDWHEISRAIGAVSSGFADTVAANRFGGSFDNTIKTDRMLARFFKRTMLSGLTNAQRAAVMPLSHEYLLNLARRYTENRDANNARALMAELGIADAQAFSEWVLQSDDIPTVEDLYDSNGVETKHGAEWMTAMNRYVDQVIQNPKGYDRPLMANNPTGRLMYGILSFSMSFYANIWKRQAALIRGIGARKGVPAAMVYAGFQLAPSLIALYLVQTVVSTIREAVFNPERWEDWEEKDVLEENLLKLGLTRSFSAGLADPVIQAFTGLKYQRDLANLAIGAFPSLVMQSLQGMLQPLVQNTEKTNNAEYKAAQSGFQLTIAPLIVYALTMAPGGKLLNPVYGLGMQYLTAPATRDKAVDMVVGKKDSRKSKEEKRAEKRETGRATGREGGGEPRSTGR